MEVIVKSALELSECRTVDRAGVERPGLWPDTISLVRDPDVCPSLSASHLSNGGEEGKATSESLVRMLCWGK